MTRLARRVAASPTPVLVAVRLRRHRPRARGVRRPRRARRLRHPLDHRSTPGPAAPTPRIVETPRGLVNAIGLQNPGVEHSSPPSCRGWSQQGARVVVSHRRQVAGGVRRAGAAPGPRAGRRRRRGQPRPRPTPTAPGSSTSASPSTPPASVGRRPPRPAARRAGARQAALRRRPRGRDGAGRRSTPAPPPSWSATRCPPRMPDGRPGGLSGPAIRPLALRCVAEVAPRLPGRRRSSGAAASSTPTTPGPSSTPVPWPSRSAPRCSTTPRPRAGSPELDEPQEHDPPGRGRMTTFGARLHAAIAATAARSAPASTRTPRCCTSGGSTTTSPGWSGSR